MHKQTNQLSWDVLKGSTLRGTRRRGAYNQDRLGGLLADKCWRLGCANPFADVQGGHRLIPDHHSKKLNVP